jgi:hypothetical protein
MSWMFCDALTTELRVASCVKRNSASTCTYVHGQRERSSQVQKSSNSPKDVQSQVRHLEELVISLMNKTAKNAALSGKPQPPITPDASSVSNSSNATSPSQSPDQVANTTVDTEESFGRISIEDDQLNYVGSSHWTAILDNVSTFLHSRSHCRQDSSTDFNRSRS